MALPYHIATLLYCFNDRDEVLLLERAQEPNRGYWSPCGGKLHTEIGESPYTGACREAQEELGLSLQPADLHLTGLVSEHGYQGQAHWLMFLFEVKPRLKTLPPKHREGSFKFFARDELANLKLPQSDVEQIWPLFWKHRRGFFAAHCHCRPDGSNQWVIEESTRAQPMKAKPNNSITEVTCLKCGHKWYPRSIQKPKSCPVCKRFDWQKPPLPPREYIVKKP